jgi:hypothetical protein
MSGNFCIISGEAGHLSFPIPRGLQFTSRNWMEEIYLLYLVNTLTYT